MTHRGASWLPKDPFAAVVALKNPTSRTLSEISEVSWMDMNDSGQVL